MKPSFSEPCADHRASAASPSFDSRTLESTPVVVTGLSESGTAAAISALAALGLDVVDPGVSADFGPDVSVWTEDESFDPSRFGLQPDLGRRLLEAVGPRSGAWGFEDPRGATLLDFWDELLADARFVLVYRNPWDVSDALQRSGSETFLRQPEDAPRLWCLYNRHVLDFHDRHPDRCLLVSLEGLLARPEAFAEEVNRKLGLSLDASFPDGGSAWAARERPRFLHTPLDDPLPRLFFAAFPETFAVYSSLERAADGLPARRSDDFVGSVGLVESVPPPRSRAVAHPDEAAEAPVAVVIPCRDHGPQLIEAIASVERSIAEPYELIVVDDGSTHAATVAILERLEEGGYRIERQGPEGVSAARNRAFESVTARYVIPLDADNRLRPGSFPSEAIAMLDADPGIGVVYGDRYEFGLREGRVAGEDFDIHKLLGGNYIDTCAVVRWTTWSDVGGYDEGIAGWEDWELWIRVARRGWRFRHLDQVAFDYRVRPGSLVTTLEDPQVLKATLDRVIAHHREVFEPYLIQQLGHGLGLWTLLLLEERDRLRALAPPCATTATSGAPRQDADGPNAGSRAPLRRSRL